MSMKTIDNIITTTGILSNIIPVSTTIATHFFIEPTKISVPMSYIVGLGFQATSIGYFSSQITDYTPYQLMSVGAGFIIPPLLGAAIIPVKAYRNYREKAIQSNGND